MTRVGPGGVSHQATRCLADLLQTRAAAQPDAPALLAHGQRILTYRELFELVEATAARLDGLGVRAGDRIAVVVENGPLMAAAFLGIASCAACAPLNPAYGPPEFAFYLGDLNARLLVVEAGSQSPAIEVARSKGIPLVELVPDRTAGAGSFSFAGPVGRARFAGADQVALVLHTSGTTSRPKIVPLTQANLCASAAHVREALRLAESDRCLNVMPLFHIHGLVAALLGSLAAGASVACCPGFRAAEFFSSMAACRPTWYTAVPTMHQAIVRLAEANRQTIAQVPLRFIRSCSAPLAPRLLSELESAFGAPVIESYGMTEAAHQIACNPLPPRGRKPGTVGVAAGPEVAILPADGSGQPLPPGTVGEIAIRGPNVTSGYESSPAANEASFTGGWFRTGDQGWMDEEGYLTICGRLKEIINRGGEKVSPREIDEVLLDHPAVDQALTFAMPHPSLGEDIAAAVVPARGASAIESKLRTFAASRLAAFKVPTRIIAVDQIPKGPTGKPQRIGLAERLADRLKPSFVAPRTAREDRLARLWSEVLSSEPPGIDDNFFQSGGDSIRATQLAARIGRELGRDLGVATIFAAPTIRELIEALDRAEPATPRQAPVIKRVARPGAAAPILNTRSPGSR